MLPQSLGARAEQVAIKKATDSGKDCQTEHNIQERQERPYPRRHRVAIVHEVGIGVSPGARWLPNRYWSVSLARVAPNNLGGLSMFRKCMMLLALAITGEILSLTATNSTLGQVRRDRRVTIRQPAPFVDTVIFYRKKDAPANEVDTM